MDRHAVRPVSRIRADAIVSRVLSRFFRRRTLRDERGFARDGTGVIASELPQLVPRTLSIRVRHIPLRAGGAMSRPTSPGQAIAADDAVAAFAADVGYYLLLEPRQLPSRYLYDPLGSALFDAICWLPW